MSKYIQDLVQSMEEISEARSNPIAVFGKEKVEVLDQIIYRMNSENEDVITASTAVTGDEWYGHRLEVGEREYIGERLGDIEMDMQLIVNHVMGSCQNDIEDGVDYYYPGKGFLDLQDSDFNEIDNCTFRCTQCGWWCDSGEANESPEGDGDICNDCDETNRDDEDED